jgi:hypothetical protein
MEFLKMAQSLTITLMFINFFFIFFLALPASVDGTTTYINRIGSGEATVNTIEDWFESIRNDISGLSETLTTTARLLSSPLLSADFAQGILYGLTSLPGIALIVAKVFLATITGYLIWIDLLISPIGAFAMFNAGLKIVISFIMIIGIGQFILPFFSAHKGGN